MVRYCYVCANEIKPKEQVIVLDKGYHNGYFRYRKRIIGETHLECAEEYFGIKIKEIPKKKRD